MALKRLLAATDLSERSERALQRAAALCRQHGAELHILHAVDDDQPADVVQREVRQAQGLLETQAQALRDVAGTAPVFQVATGDPFVEIVQAAEKGDVDVVAMGPHRRRILRDVFVGTTIERVIRTGCHPVLMVNSQTTEPYRRVVVAIDLSEHSANALRTARAHGFLAGAQVLLVHAVESIAKSMMIYASIERERIEAQVAEDLAEGGRNLIAFIGGLGLDDLRYLTRVVEGPPFYAIAKLIERERPDLLVIGTRGLTGTKRLLLGSVADALLRNVECDVLAVPRQAP